MPDVVGYSLEEDSLDEGPVQVVVSLQVDEGTVFGPVGVDE